MEPGYRCIDFVEPRCDEQRVVRALLKADCDVLIAYVDGCGGIDEIPEDVQAQLLVPILQQHIESWIDERIPALNGKTPRQAVKTKAGRDKVVAMLKDQENSIQRQHGGEQVDFSRVYRELGLTR